MNECLKEETVCPTNSQCVNYAGRFECKCNDYFEPYYKSNKTVLMFCKRKIL